MTSQRRPSSLLGKLSQKVKNEERRKLREVETTKFLISTEKTNVQKACQVVTP